MAYWRLTGERAARPRRPAPLLVLAQHLNLQSSTPYGPRARSRHERTSKNPSRRRSAGGVGSQGHVRGPVRTCHSRPSQPGDRNSTRRARGFRGHGAALGTIFRNRSGDMDESPEQVRRLGRGACTRRHNGKGSTDRYSTKLNGSCRAGTLPSRNWSATIRSAYCKARQNLSAPPAAAACSGRLAQCGGRPNAVDELAPVPGEPTKIAIDLNSMPELVRLSEECAEANRHGRRNRPPAMYDFVDRTRSNANRTTHCILRNPHRFEVFFKKNLARCNRSLHCNTLNHILDHTPF